MVRGTVVVLKPSEASMSECGATGVVITVTGAISLSLLIDRVDWKRRAIVSGVARQDNTSPEMA